ncbi:hypothetical protein BTVI_132785 [Pitangus sulphuratus]|nr:hypothetical protein BTVI_132785 [Pitangus sulphuratus]
MLEATCSSASAAGSVQGSTLSVELNCPVPALEMEKVSGQQEGSKCSVSVDSGEKEVINDVGKLGKLDVAALGQKLPIDGLVAFCMHLACTEPGTCPLGDTGNGIPGSWMSDEFGRKMDAYPCLSTIINAMKVALAKMAISKGQQYGTSTSKAYYLEEERGNEAGGVVRDEGRIEFMPADLREDKGEPGMVPVATQSLGALGKTLHE